MIDPKAGPEETHGNFNSDARASSRTHLPYHYQIDSAPQRRKRRRRLKAFLWLAFWAVCVSTAFHLVLSLTNLK